MEITTPTATHTVKPVAAASRLNVPQYAELLKRFAPKVIESRKERKLAAEAIDELLAIGKRTPEQSALLSLLATLVDQFERKEYPAAPIEPREALAFLLEENGLKAADLAEIMGGRSRVSEVLSGKREISREQAKKLAARFSVSAALFI